MFQDSSGAIHAGVAFNRSSSVPEPVKLTSTFYPAPGGFAALGGGLPNYKSMQFLWFKKEIGRFSTTALALNTGWQLPDTTLSHLQTLGINPAYRFGRKGGIQASFYYQRGKNRADQAVNAYLASLALTYRRAHSSWVLGTDWVSGTNANESPSTTFAPLFSTHHKFYGLMDYFYVGNSHQQLGKSVGLIDIFIKPTFQLSDSSLTAMPMALL